VNALEPSELLAQRRIIVCVGTGGVGKTTVAAALAIAAARSGRRALVMTIDPARRLADALGVGELDNEARELSDQARRQLAIEGEGRLFAMMLDMKRTFDDLVDRFAEDEAAKQRVLDNRIYQHVSDALAGSGEYAAMEKVYEMAERSEFDVIVVDTPPSQHALDFLEAPQRLLEFLDSRLVQVLLHPAFAAGRFGFRLFQGATQRIFKLIERISGIAFLEDISEFLLAFEGMSEGFKVRANSVRELLLGPESAFVLIAGASPQASRSAGEFLDHLEVSDHKPGADGFGAARVKALRQLAVDVDLDARTERPMLVGAFKGERLAWLYEALEHHDVFIALAFFLALLGHLDESLFLAVVTQGQLGHLALAFVTAGGAFRHWAKPASFAAEALDDFEASGEEPRSHGIEAVGAGTYCQLPVDVDVDGRARGFLRIGSLEGERLSRLQEIVEHHELLAVNVQGHLDESLLRPLVAQSELGHLSLAFVAALEVVVGKRGGRHHAHPSQQERGLYEKLFTRAHGVLLFVHREPDLGMDL